MDPPVAGADKSVQHLLNVGTASSKAASSLGDPRWGVRKRLRSHPPVKMETMTDATPPEIRVIGRCSVASCQRPASTHLVLAAGSRTLAGAVCDHCARASKLALFLLDTLAA